MESLKHLFQIDPCYIYLNHGSFGACPRKVFRAYQAWQRKLEHQPVQFFARELPTLILQARTRLAEALRTTPDDLVFITNATHGVNIVARSLQLQPGDEVLSSNHEYGACEYTWQFLCRKSGARYVRQPIDLPVFSKEQVIDQFWQGVTPRTRVIYLSHVTSPTAMRLPLEEICHQARQAGILTVIDGAHAPGNYPLDLPSLGADFYTGNCHKWMMAPKGCAFLFARPEVQSLVEPLVVSWGYHTAEDGSIDSSYVNLLENVGTRDPAAFLAVQTVLDFMQEHDWDTVRSRCHQLLKETLEEIRTITQTPAVYPDDEQFYSQMAFAPLPQDTDLSALGKWLFEDNRIELPCIQWNGIKGLRISVQGYVTRRDLGKLTTALKSFYS